MKILNNKSKIIARPETTKLAIQALERNNRQMKAHNFRNSGHSRYTLTAQNRRIEKFIKGLHESGAD